MASWVVAYWKTQGADLTLMPVGMSVCISIIGGKNTRKNLYFIQSLHDCVLGSGSEAEGFCVHFISLTMKIHIHVWSLIVLIQLDDQGNW